MTTKFTANPGFNFYPASYFTRKSDLIHALTECARLLNVDANFDGLTRFELEELFDERIYSSGFPRASRVIRPSYRRVREFANRS